MASDAAVASSRGHDEIQSVPRVPVHGVRVPVDWLIVKHDPQRYSTQQLSTPAQTRQTHRNIVWAQQREKYIAAAAAGVHLALFSFNLLFWGFEGMPPDRFNPTNLRLKLNIKPGRYGNMDGTRRVYYDNLDGGAPT